MFRRLIQTMGEESKITPLNRYDLRLLNSLVNVFLLLSILYPDCRSMKKNQSVILSESNAQIATTIATSSKPWLDYFSQGIVQRLSLFPSSSIKHSNSHLRLLPILSIAFIDGYLDESIIKESEFLRKSYDRSTQNYNW